MAVKQSVRKWPPGRGNKLWELICFRGDAVVMKLYFCNSKDTDYVANHWVSGANMGKIAALIQTANITLKHPPL